MTVGLHLVHPKTLPGTHGEDGAEESGLLAGCGRHLSMEGAGCHNREVIHQLCRSEGDPSEAQPLRHDQEGKHRPTQSKGRR